MVHLSAINHDHDEGQSSGPAGAGSVSSQLADKAQSLLRLPSDSDEFTTSVYGSRFACEELPRTKMPEDQMPRDVAYRMIKDDLSLDNNPRLK